MLNSYFKLQGINFRFSPKIIKKKTHIPRIITLNGSQFIKKDKNYNKDQSSSRQSNCEQILTALISLYNIKIDYFILQSIHKLTKYTYS